MRTNYCIARLIRLNSFTDNIITTNEICDYEFMSIIIILSSWKWAICLRALIALKIYEQFVQESFPKEVSPCF